MSERYKGHIVDARAYELRGGFGWTAEVYVAEDVGPDTIDHRFVLKGTFPTRDAAISAAVATGKHEIDKRLQAQSGA